MTDPNETPEFREGLEYCLPCIAEWIQARKRRDLSNIVEGAEMASLPVIRLAVTKVPQWQNLQLAGQMVMSCVSVPSCLEHIDATEKTPEQKAIEGGFILPGRA